MNTRSISAATLLTLSACATGREMPSDYATLLRTNTEQGVLVACIERAAGAASMSDASGTIIDVPAAQPPRRYIVTRDKGETIVSIQGPYVDGGSTIDRAVTNCLVTTAAPN